MSLLLASALAWVAVHAGIAGTTVRRAVAARIGDAGFRGVFSLLSVAAISALIISYGRVNRADPVALWSAPAGLAWVLLPLMAAAFVLFVASVAAPNPTAVGGERLLGREPRGWLRVTRHPMLWSFALWSGVHVAGNGTLASLLFFGAFGVTALLGMPSIDRKLAARDPDGWRGLAATTSILPFAAILAGRQRLVPRELGLVAPLGGLAAWGVLLAAHPWLFGVSPVP